MAVAGGAVVVFKRLRQPSILGYLLAGILVGPFTFPNPPVTNIEIVRLLADLGLVLLLFAVGMEFGWRRIRRVGLGVLLIGSIEMLVMVSIGYQLGRLLGWTPVEAIYLGSAMAISSSAILIKVLRDSGKLTTRAGKLIVGLLVVEDFVAVILLTLLSGLATSDATGFGDVGPLVLKLVLFTVASVALGAVFVPRLLSYIHRFESPETLVLAALALCFALALIGEELGLSAAAGAFLIGAVIGDTPQAEQMTRTISPIRDMFGALFFVSIGMLINVHVIGDHIVPAIVIAGVFIVGKVAVNTFGAFIAGQPDRVPIQFGMRTPQVGEFSLAMVKVGVESQTIGAFMYQVLAAVTAITSLFYPYIVRSADRVADLLRSRSPESLRRSLSGYTIGAMGLGGTLNPDLRQRVRGPALSVLVNFLIVVVLMALGALVVGLSPDIARPLGISEGVVAKTVAFAALALSFPSSVAIWRGLERLTEQAATYLILRDRPPRMRIQAVAKNLVRDSVMILVIFAVGIWVIPLVARLLSLGPLEVPLPFMVVAAMVYVAIRFLRQVHRHLVESFSKTFLGGHLPGGETAQGGVGRGGERSDSLLPAVTVRSEYAPTVPPEAEPALAGDPPASAKVVTIADAEISALTVVENDPSPYASRLAGAPIVWEFKKAAEVDGYFLITLRFRKASAPSWDHGEEDIYVDTRGRVRVRQIRSWPKSVRSGFSPHMFYGGAAVLFAVVLAAGALYLLR